MSMAASPLPSSAMSSEQSIVVMGVSGCGKTSVGKLLASYLGYRFIEGDGRHPDINTQKMSAGEPLTDDDRRPWLEALGAELAGTEAVVVSCSALKRSYRNLLRTKAGKPIRFLFLQGSRETLGSRLNARRAHFMPLSLLDSQLATLELPLDEPDVMTIEIEQSPERIAGVALSGFIAQAVHRKRNALNNGRDL
jgi:gluconokinase